MVLFNHFWINRIQCSIYEIQLKTHLAKERGKLHNADILVSEEYLYFKWCMRHFGRKTKTSKCLLLINWGKRESEANKKKTKTDVEWENWG